VTATTVTIAIALGLAAGLLSGMLGVGGGILFVPALVGLGLGQVEAAATSLLAIVPTAAVGLGRHYAFGTVRVGAAVQLGLASIVGVEVGVRIATSIPEDLLRRLFAVFLLAIAGQLTFGAVRGRRRYPEPR
jgi:uncharacterized membrane protein YfcA